MLINLSNHPSDRWCEKQLDAAHNSFGEIVDITFPQVNPMEDNIYIQSLVYEYYKKIMALYANNYDITVHIMGELTFCFALVIMLKQNNIPCVAACTARNTVDLPDGRKETQFQFVRFRKY